MLLPVSVDAFTGPNFITWRQNSTCAPARTTRRIDLIEQLQAIPAGHVFSQALLKADPIWDPLRNDARFQSLASKPDPS